MLPRACEPWTYALGRPTFLSNAVADDDTEKALRHYRGLLDDVPREYLEGVLSSREGSAENKARLLHTLGNAFLQTGQAAEALSICEREFEEYGRIEPVTEQSKYVRAVALRVLNPDDLHQVAIRIAEEIELRRRTGQSFERFRLQTHLGMTLV